MIGSPFTFMATPPTMFLGAMFFGFLDSFAGASCVLCVVVEDSLDSSVFFAVSFVFVSVVVFVSCDIFLLLFASIAVLEVALTRAIQKNVAQKLRNERNVFARFCIFFLIWDFLFGFLDFLHF